MYYGDYALGKNVDLKFTTINSSGIVTALASGTVAAYPDNSTTEITAGITLTADFDSRTGLNHIRIAATSGNGYASGVTYALVLTAGTVGGDSVVGYVVGHFSLEARSALRPATADRTIVVDASGIADANVEKWNTTSVPAEHTAGYPIVTIKDGTGTGEIDTTSGGVKLAASQASTTFDALTVTNGFTIGTGMAISAGGLSITHASGNAITLTAAQHGIHVNADTASGGHNALNLVSLTGSSIAAPDDIVSTFNGDLTGDVQGSVNAIGTGGISTASFAAGAINAAAIGADAITAAKIADGAIDAATFAAGAINAAALASDAITAAKIATGAITAAKFAAGAIDAAAVADGAIDAGAIADGAITAAKIAADAITAAKIADGAIDAATFAAGAITATVVATGAIDSDALAASAISAIQSGLSTLSAAQVWDLADGIETGLTPRGAVRLISAASAGELSGAGTATNTIRNAVADSKDRIVATVDADGNRTAIVYDLT